MSLPSDCSVPFPSPSPSPSPPTASNPLQQSTNQSLSLRQRGKPPLTHSLRAEHRCTYVSCCSFFYIQLLFMNPVVMNSLEYFIHLRKSALTSYPPPYLTTFLRSKSNPTPSTSLSLPEKTLSLTSHTPHLTAKTSNSLDERHNRDISVSVHRESYFPKTALQVLMYQVFLVYFSCISHVSPSYHSSLSFLIYPPLPAKASVHESHPLDKLPPTTTHTHPGTTGLIKYPEGATIVIPVLQSLQACNSGFGSFDIIALQRH